MEHRKYSKVSPKKVKAWSQSNTKSMSGPPFWRAFSAGSLPRDALETMLRWNPEKPQKNHFWGTFFRTISAQILVFFSWRFFVMFCNLIFTNFLVSEHQRAPTWGPFGYQGDDISNKCGKIATAFSLETGHQNQAFQGLHFKIFHHFWCVLPRPVMFTMHRRHYSYYLKFMDSLGLHFGHKNRIIFTSFF